MCLGMVNGFGGSNLVTRWMVGRKRITSGSLNWNPANAITGPVYVGYSDFGGAGEAIAGAVEYIQNKPVEAGLATRPEDYRWLYISKD